MHQLSKVLHDIAPFYQHRSLLRSIRTPFLRLSPVLATSVSRLSPWLPSRLRLRFALPLLLLPHAWSCFPPGDRERRDRGEKRSRPVRSGPGGGRPFRARRLPQGRQDLEEEVVVVVVVVVAVLVDTSKHVAAAAAYSLHTYVPTHCTGPPRGWLCLHLDGARAVGGGQVAARAIRSPSRGAFGRARTRRFLQRQRRRRWCGAVSELVLRCVGLRWLRCAAGRCWWLEYLYFVDVIRKQPGELSLGFDGCVVVKGEHASTWISCMI